MSDNVTCLEKAHMPQPTNDPRTQQLAHDLAQHLSRLSRTSTSAPIREACTRVQRALIEDSKPSDADMGRLMCWLLARDLQRERDAANPTVHAGTSWSRRRP